jgi:hypothetical protein
VGFGFAFRQLESYHDALTIMGATVLASSILSLFIVIKDQESIIHFCGKEEDEEDEEIVPNETSERHVTTEH